MSTLNKYIWVVDTLHRAGNRGLSLKELNEKWITEDMSRGEPISRQTFDRWKWGIIDTMGVVIECYLTGGYRYYISNPELLESGELGRWLLDTYTTFNSLSKNIAFKDRILLEEIPSSREFLNDILDSIRGNRLMEITYKNFVGGGEHTFPVAPYCVKMFQRRWYMLALSVDEEILRTYALDRIGGLTITDKTFKLPEDFDAKEYFSTYFGITPDTRVKPERIVLRAWNSHKNYMRSLPLHSSQQEINDCGAYAEFELRLSPTFDFIMELSRYGTLVEVREPESLRRTMRLLAEELLEMYKDE